MAFSQTTTKDELVSQLAATTVLDLAFAMDCTGSMGSYIASAQQNIRTIIEQIVAAEKADVKFALVAYRDHPPQESSFVTKVYPFTSSLSTMKQCLNECSASGGGDTPEAVADALHDCYKLEWREAATKIVILIADAPPHGVEKNGDSFPNGCPLGLDPVKICHDMAAKGITLNVVGCEPSIVPYKSLFMGLAYITGGRYLPLASAGTLSDVIVHGAAEEISLEKMMADVHREVETSGGAVDDAVQAERVFNLFKTKQVKAKKLQRNCADLPSASPQALKISSKSSLAEVALDYTHDTVARDDTVSRDETARRGSGSLLGRMFSRKAAAAPGAAAGPSEPSMAAAAPVAECYSAVEDDISMEQCSRMVSKSRARHGYSSSSATAKW